MATDREPQLLIDWEASDARLRWRESAVGAGVLHLAFLIMVLIGPRGFPLQVAWAGGEPLQLVVLVPDNVLTLYVPPDLVQIPESTTPSDLTEEERGRLVLRSPFGEQSPSPGAVLTLPREQIEQGGGDTAAPPSAVPGQPGEEDVATSVPEAGTESETTGTESDPEVTLLDIPRPQQTPRDRSLLPGSSAGQVIEDSLRRAPGNQGGFSGPGPGQGVADPNLNTPFPTILSDTRGVDFTPYLARLVNEVRRNWYAILPDSARFLGEKGRVVIVFTILKNGEVPAGDPRIVGSSGRSYLDRPAQGAIRGAQPFPPLPEEFTGDEIVLQFSFYYNIPIPGDGQP